MLQHVLVEGIETFGRHGGVVVPPDRFCDAVGLDHMLVLGRPAGELARGHEESAPAAKCAFAPGKGGFDQRRLHQVVIDIAQPCDALIL